MPAGHNICVYVLWHRSLRIHYIRWCRSCWLWHHLVLSDLRVYIRSSITLLIKLSCRLRWPFILILLIYIVDIISIFSFFRWGEFLYFYPATHFSFLLFCLVKIEGQNERPRYSYIDQTKDTVALMTHKEVMETTLDRENWKKLYRQDFF